MIALPLEQEIEYPTSDGQPMAETTLHHVVMSNVIGGLERPASRRAAEERAALAEERTQALAEELARLRRRV